MDKQSNNKGFKKIYLLGAILVILAIVATAAISSLGAAERPVVDVGTAAAVTQRLEGSCVVNGTLAPEQSANITSRTSGKVLSVAVDKGDVVHAGDLLVKLDDADIQLSTGAGGLGKDNVDKYKVAYDLARGLYEKNRELFDNGALSEVACEQSRVSMEQARIQYETAAAALGEQLSKTSITAPFDGVVVSIGVQEGDTIAQGAAIASIVAMDRVVLKGTVPESVVSMIVQGQDVTASADALPGMDFSGKVSFISPVSVPAGQIFPIEISIPNPDGLLKAGMTANARIRVQTVENALTVPSAAVFERNGKDCVYVVADGTAELREVVTGISDGESTVVISGITEGTVVVSENAGLLMDGDRVAVNGN